MRLKVAVQRNNLAPVRLVYNADTSHTPGKQHIETVADLLSAINDLVPLESANGQWGLEDYVVEVNGYECLHYLEAKDVLREDDEVIVRGLSTWELRERRGGGRLQITSDGRHLIDGACWGKRRRPGDRPDLYIPPRKKRRLLEGEDDATNTIEDPQTSAWADFSGSQRMIEDVAHSLEQPQQTLVRFLDQQVPSSDDEDDDEEDGDWDDDGDDADTEESAIDETDAQSLEDELAANGGPHGDTQDSFAAFSSPFKSTKRSPRSDPPSKVADEEAPPNLGHYKVDLRNTRSNSRRTQTVDSSAEQEIEVYLQPSPSETNNVNGQHDRRAASDASDDSSSTDDTSSEDEDSSSSEDDADGASLSGEENSSSDDDTSSEDTSDSNDMSSSDESDSGASLRPENNLSKKPHVQSNLTNDFVPDKQGEKSNVLQTSLIPRQVSHNVAPGQGSLRTRKNNERKKLNKLMDRLKAEGKLPPDADFSQLRLYLQTSEGDTESNEIQSEATKPDDALQARKDALLKQLCSGGEITTDTSAELDRSVSQNPSMNSDIANRAAHPVNEEVAQDPVHGSSHIDQSETKSLEEGLSPKRTKLDLASSRRMVFSALGVRNPKTPAAEQAVREKLAGSAKPSRVTDSQDKTDLAQNTQTPSPDRWRKKLTLFAVECVHKNRTIEVPTFPFKHPWQIRKEKEARRRSGPPQHQPDHTRTPSEHEHDAETSAESHNEDIGNFHPDRREQVSHQMASSRVSAVGASYEENEIPTIDDFEPLPSLKASDLVEGAFIAYKELHMNERFEPEHSPYRGAWIMSHENDGLEVLLATKYRRPLQGYYDEDTGERIYNGLEMPNDDDEEPDDGVRELSFSQLIEPKLVSASPNQPLVPATQNRESSAKEATTHSQVSSNVSLRGGQIDGSTDSRVSETQGDINDVRRDEINGMIKDAGFDSALDDQLLRPLGPKTADHTESIAQPSHFQHHDENSEDMQHEWRSRPVLPSSLNEPPPISSNARESSAPSESMVESVRYPNLSQLELTTPSIHIGSSSHQDAQRVTPVPLMDTSAMLKFPVMDATGQDETILGRSSPLPSEVPQTQSSNINGHEPESSPELTASSSQHDTDESSGLSDSEDPDDDNLPSLQKLTSSQLDRKEKRAKTSGKESPEPTRKSPRLQSQRHKTKTTDWSDDDNSFKASQSQQLRLSQIPAEAEAVDLTNTSTDTSPAKPRNRTARNSRSKASSSYRQASALRRSFQGLGEKSLLKRKKSTL